MEDDSKVEIKEIENEILRHGYRLPPQWGDSNIDYMRQFLHDVEIACLVIEFRERIF